MPSRSGWAAQFSRLKAQSAELEIDKAETRRVQTERNLTYQEQELGSERQVAGQLGGEDASVAPYLGRYTLNEGGATSIGYGQLERSRGDLARINDLMQQAEDAARSGDTSLAARLRSEAEQGTFGGGNLQYAGNDASNIHALFTFNQDPEGRAKSRLGSTMARTVGGLVKQGREFLDPYSETSQRYKKSLTEGADRAIAAESRAGMRRQRDIGLAFGAGRNPLAERSVAAASRNQFATARAQVHTQAAAQFESFSRMFAADSVDLGQRWLQNQGEIRETFQGAMDNLAMMAGKFHMEGATLERQYSMALKAGGGKKGSAVGGALAGAGSGAATGAMFGPWGAAIGAVVGGVAGGIGANNPSY